MIHNALVYELFIIFATFLLRINHWDDKWEGEGPHNRGMTHVVFSPCMIRTGSFKEASWYHSILFLFFPPPSLQVRELGSVIVFVGG